MATFHTARDVRQHGVLRGNPTMPPPPRPLSASPRDSSVSAEPGSSKPSALATLDLRQPHQQQRALGVSKDHASFFQPRRAFDSLHPNERHIPEGNVDIERERLMRMRDPQYYPHSAVPSQPPPQSDQLSHNSCRRRSLPPATDPQENGQAGRGMTAAAAGRASHPAHQPHDFPLRSRTHHAPPQSPHPQLINIQTSEPRHQSHSHHHLLPQASSFVEPPAIIKSPSGHDAFSDNNHKLSWKYTSTAAPRSGKEWDSAGGTPSAAAPSRLRSSGESSASSRRSSQSPSMDPASSTKSFHSLSPLIRDLPNPHFASPSNYSPRQRAAGSPSRSSHSGGGRGVRGSPSSRGSSPLSHGSVTSSTSSSRKRQRSELGRSSVENVNTLRSSAEAPDFIYELIIRQQPGRAAAAGLNPTALSRLPIIPSPILQLVVKDKQGQRVPHSYVVQNLPYLVCNCALLPADEEQDNSNQTIDYTSAATGDTSAAVSTGAAPSGADVQLAMLCGTRVYSAIEANDTDGQPGMFFIFWDVSVRQVGKFRMRFNMVEALPGSPTLATVTSQPFDVVPLNHFPGNIEIATELSRHFQRQGLSIYLPPLGVSTGR